MRKTIASIIAVFALAGCASEPTTPANAPADTGSGAALTVPAPYADAVNCEYIPNGSPAKPVSAPDGQDVPAVGTSAVTLMLNGKPVLITLERAKAPCAVRSFETLAEQGYFDKTSCHRLVDGSGLFILQCGDPTGTGSGGPGYAFADELAGITGYPAGTVAMANAGPNTNGSQFFLVYEDSNLQPSYTVFGNVDAAGLEELRNLALGGQDGSFGASGGGKPELPAEITSVSVG
ncbi:MAG: peptidylprolyl isomerase [Propionibacteriaceae bacterium]|jgi:peptidyl-prolyl cis-trans isomerase B (cyclophilin B)|nr:peptidylprolyl isomerase [Propionibacteriaceae bacterium]